MRVCVCVCLCVCVFVCVCVCVCLFVCVLSVKSFSIAVSWFLDLLNVLQDHIMKDDL